MEKLSQAEIIVEDGIVIQITESSWACEGSASVNSEWKLIL
jgi:hypothetical protein